MNIFKLCAAILQDFGHPKNRCWHTQLNVCEKEGFSCFLYLIQIFDYSNVRSFRICHPSICDDDLQKFLWLIGSVVALWLFSCIFFSLLANIVHIFLLFLFFFCLVWFCFLDFFCLSQWTIKSFFSSFFLYFLSKDFFEIEYWWINIIFIYYLVINIFPTFNFKNILNEVKDDKSLCPVGGSNPWPSRY